MKAIFSIILLLGFICAKAQDPNYPPAPPALANIVAAEYWIDTDPGIGNATSITVSPGTDISNASASINTNGLSNGIHRYSLRTKSVTGKWSHTIISEILIDHNPNYVSAPPAVTNIVAAEYWIDTDPGMGNATAISVSAGTDIANILATLNTTGLSNGIHRYGFRTKSIDGKWSLTNINNFLVDHNPDYATAPAAITDIVAAEYFIDTDPGMGNGTSITITPGQNISNIYFSANTTGLSNSTHYLVIRTKNSEDVWSLSNVVPFLVNTDFSYPPAPAAPGNITYAEYFFDTDPGFGNGTIIPVTPGVDLSNVSFVANTSALNDGVHTLFIRSLDDWSITNYVSFLKGEPLDIKLLHFNAVANNGQVLITWQTGSEEITDKMVLQRSSDGIHFTDWATVNPRGIPSAYTYRDEHPFSGRNYYRLKMTDNKNTITYSTIATVNISQNKGLGVQAFPNPVMDRLHLMLPDSVIPSAILIITNTDGREIIRMPVKATQIEINMAGWSKGVYLIRYQNGTNQQVIKILKD
ncbi:MAG: T9SS type A sorting domain-containing protein [Chitinophagaceae bacterium]|nr:T9SS type A sorting domain-containing protein [Chitinophagaceae bacterium]